MEKFSKEFPFYIERLNNRHAPLIKISASWKIEYVSTKTDKVSLIKNRQEWDRFIMPVPWEWRTDVFVLEEEQLAKV